MPRTYIRVLCMSRCPMWKIVHHPRLHPSAAQLICFLTGVLELMHFIKQENIKTLIDYVVEQHIDRSACCFWLPCGLDVVAPASFLTSASVTCRALNAASQFCSMFLFNQIITQSTAQNT